LVVGQFEIMGLAAKVADHVWTLEEIANLA